MTEVTETPILFLVFNRPNTTALVMEAIRAARPKRLYVAADGPRDCKADEVERCAEVRQFATDVDWPCEVRTLFRDRNLGARNAVSSAITWFFEQEGEGIILEDDCLPSMDFFPYCAELLERYRDDERVMTICGSAYANIRLDYPSSYYFCYYADIWGWATWRRAWQHYDSRMQRWPAFREKGGLETLAAGRPWHLSYWTGKFDATFEGRIPMDCWDYQWIFTVIEQGGLACYPTRNLISNLGWGPDATHTIVSNRNGHPLANRVHDKLEFPLVHPNDFVRFSAFEQEIESVRLELCPPSVDLVTSLRAARALAAELLRRVPKAIVRRTTAIVRRMIPAELLGMWDYFKPSGRKDYWGGPFNGQLFRKELFISLIGAVQAAALIETGTFLGSTTELLASTKLPVFTVEHESLNYGYSRARLWWRPNVKLYKGDSRQVLRMLFDGPLRRFAGEPIFFYLDAHWGVDLPLAEELEIIFSKCPLAVVMIDDFQVFDDPNYDYDDYGPGKALTRDYIDSTVRKHGLCTFYPATPGNQESGARRGCVVLAKAEVHGKMLARLKLLRPEPRAACPEGASLTPGEQKMY